VSIKAIGYANNAVIARLDRANPLSIPERQRSNISAPEYWIVRWSPSSAAQSAGPVAGDDDRTWVIILAAGFRPSFANKPRPKSKRAHATLNRGRL
jgi:hypothetical protein